MSLVDTWIVKLTARRWNRLICSTIGQLCEVGVINSQQFHTLAKEFDPTQGGRVGRIVAGGRDTRYSSALLERSKAGSLSAAIALDHDRSR